LACACICFNVNVLSFFVRHIQNHAECLLKSCCLSVCLYAWNDMRMDKLILNKFDIVEFYKGVLSHFSFYLDWRILMTTLHNTRFSWCNLITVSHSTWNMKTNAQLFQQITVIKKKVLIELDCFQILFYSVNLVLYCSVTLKHILNKLCVCVCICIKFSFRGLLTNMNKY
jgi:hypothetical protein